MGVLIVLIRTKMSMINEFKTFIIKGNAIELAIGVVIGVAFNAVVNSLVHDVILGLVANLFAQPDFSSLAWGALKWGSFVNTVINLAVVGLSVFVVIKVINRLAGTKFGQTVTVETERK
jgi:large conductance mechanosensitive channel